MRLLFSFILSFLVYISILGFFVFVISNKNSEKPKIVYIHHAIIKEKKPLPSHNKQTHTKLSNKTAPTKEAKKPQPKKSKDNFSKGGEKIKYDDIFQNVPENVPTPKIKHTKKDQLTIQRGVYESVQKDIKKISQNITTVTITSQSGDKKNISILQKELGKIWNNIYTNPGDYLKIKIVIYNNKLNFYIIATNLDTIRLNEFKSKVRTIDIYKIGNLNAEILFKSELKE